MTRFTDVDLYQRGVETLLASWEAYAHGSGGAVLQRLPGVAAAVFPAEPERSVYNNALFARGLPAADRAAAFDAMTGVYQAAGVERFAAWVHERDHAMRAELEQRGFVLDTTTRAMGMALDDLRAPLPQLERVRLDWVTYLSAAELPPGLLAGADHAAFHVVAVCFEGEPAATALAFDRDGDCGIYNVGTLERARRRGLGSAVTAFQLHDARARGCQTASLQATPMAERLYAALGFRDLGRYQEYLPPGVEHSADS
jgi:ribosomal protein S18 acetylase RimI-like enzyme